MGILQSLAENEDGKSYIITLGDVRLKVGQSDKDAVGMLIDLLDKYAGKEYTNGDLLALLTKEWVEAVANLPDSAKSFRDVIDDPKVTALWDALWWFRFLIALDEKREVVEGELA